MTEKEAQRNAVLNGGRGSGQTVRRISEIYEDKIADLKANFDYVLEGKDLEIKELKMTDEYIIKTLESKVKKLQEDLRNKRISIKNKKAEIKELELELTVKKDQLQEEINLHLHAEDYIKELERLNSNQAESLRITMLEEEKKGKRIEELENKIAGLEERCEISQDEVSRLMQENAVLKSELTKKADTNHSLVEQMAEQNEQLEQAKEIIREYYNLKNFPCASGNSINMLMYENINKQAEQFLKE